jgi:hypothetical protein
MSYPQGNALPPDPFDVPPSVPSLSFRDAPIGTSFTGKVCRLPNLVQSRDFEDNTLKFWPDGNPMMAAVFHITLPNGDERSVWAQKPSSLFAAVTDAQNALKHRMALGDTVTITLIGEKPNQTNPRLNPAKQYSVTIVPGDPFEQASVPAHAETPAPAPAPAPAPVSVPAPASNGEAVALLGQLKTLVGFGLTDEQIKATIPQATPEVLAMVRSIPS